MVPTAQEAYRAASEGDGAGTKYSSMNFAERLAAIGPDEFRVPLMWAGFAFLRDNWPNPDLAALKDALRGRLAVAPRGPRPEATIAEYASDKHLDDLIGWCLAREQESADERESKANVKVEPAFPDKGLSRED